MSLDTDITYAQYPEEKGSKPFSWEYDSQRYYMQPGETRPILTKLFHHALKLPNCPLVDIGEYQGPAAEAAAKRRQLEREVAEMEEETRKRVDSLAAKKRLLEEQKGVERATTPGKVPAPPTPRAKSGE